MTENQELSSDIIDTIVDAMLGETPQQMVRRRLRETGVFCYFKLADQPLPKLDESSGLKVIYGGLIYDIPNGDRIDSFLVYDPKRVEVRIDPDQRSTFLQLSPGRKSKIDMDLEPRATEADAAREGWTTPWAHSLGRVIRYRPIA